MPTQWTRERIELLSPGEIRTLGKNARERGAVDLATLCDEVFQAKFKAAVARASPSKQRTTKLVAKRKAFEMRGVTLKNTRWSWGGIRPADGVVVFSVWKDEVSETEKGYEYLLWGPNHDGSRPWADKHGGREQLEHCKLALAAGEAEGLLIFGERRGLDLPPDQASRVMGADPHTIIRFRPEMLGEEYWAVWDRAQTIP